MSHAGESPDRPSQVENDCATADVERLRQLLDLFLDALDAVTVPDRETPSRGRVVEHMGGPALLTALAQQLRTAVWDAQRRIEDKHIDRKGANGANVAYSIPVGWEARHYSLYHALQEIMYVVHSMTVRTERERLTSPQGVPKNSRFERGDIVRHDGLDRLQGAQKLLRMVDRDPVMADPFATLFPNARWAPGVAAVQVLVVSGEEPATAPQDSVPTDLATARSWLITPDRLLRVLGQRNAVWLKKEWPRHAPEPAWRAPAGSGMHPRYPLGDLYDSYERASGGRIKPLTYSHGLVALLESPDQIAELGKKSPRQQSGQKRSKAVPRRKSPF